MKLRSMRIEKAPELMIIPMIDIMFFLLVFFMISTLYMVEQHTIPVQLPQSAYAQQEKPKSMNVTVSKDAVVLIDEEKIPLELLGKHIAIAMGKNDNQIFILRADKMVDYGAVIQVLDEMKAAGAQHISIATERKVR